MLVYVYIGTIEVGFALHVFVASHSWRKTGSQLIRFRIEQAITPARQRVATLPVTAFTLGNVVQPFPALLGVNSERPGRRVIPELRGSLFAAVITKFPEVLNTNSVKHTCTVCKKQLVRISVLLILVLVAFLSSAGCPSFLALAGGRRRLMPRQHDSFN